MIFAGSSSLAVTDEFVTGWTDLDDSDGDAAALFGDLSALWAEAILTANLTPAERQAWTERLADWHTEAAEYGIDTAFEAARFAAVQGWDDPELLRMLRGEVASSEGTTAWAESDLASVRLNVLERRTVRPAYAVRTGRFSGGLGCASVDVLHLVRAVDMPDRPIRTHAAWL